jgi:hypothetical protein
MIHPIWLVVVGLVVFALMLAKEQIIAYARTAWAKWKASRSKPKRKPAKKPAAKSEAASDTPPESRKPAGQLVGGILAGAAIMWLLSPGASPKPTPDPVPIEGLELRGAFVGPQAATDAAAIAALSEELAASVEWDAEQPEPAVKTGVAFDDLRIRLRAILMRGDSIGARQPKARDAIAAYLDAKCGNSGGPLTPAQRSAWVGAYRDIARAAEAAYR